MKWHYSKRMPRCKLVRCGVWENSRFVGCVIFSAGATYKLVSAFSLTPTQGCELSRVALGNHQANVSKIVSIALKMLKSRCTGLRLCVSFADPEQGHIGGIYQAGNWIYTGETAGAHHFMDGNGKVWHPRNVSKDLWRRGKRRTPDECVKIWKAGKHRYIYPLDRKMRKQIEPLAQPYPKENMRSVKGDDLASSQAGRFNPDLNALVDKNEHRIQTLSDTTSEHPAAAD